MSSGERYVFAAYAVVLVAVLAYLLIIALKVARLERDLGELADSARAVRARGPERDREEAPVA